MLLAFPWKAVPQETVDALSLAFQRDNQQSASAIGPANGNIGEKGRIFHHAVGMGQAYPIWQGQNKRLCHSIWLLYLHNTMKMQTFSPVFPLAKPMAKAFCWLFLWNFKKKSINHFLGHSQIKQQPFAVHGLLLKALSESAEEGGVSWAAFLAKPCGGAGVFPRNGWLSAGYKLFWERLCHSM